MPHQRPAPESTPDVWGDELYVTLLDVIGASPRGQWFLAEFLRRNRIDPVSRAVDALDRLATVALAQRIEAPHDAPDAAEPEGEVGISDAPGSAEPITAQSIAGRLRVVAAALQASGAAPDTWRDIELLSNTVLQTDQLHDADPDRLAALSQLAGQMEQLAAGQSTTARSEVPVSSVEDLPARDRESAAVESRRTSKDFPQTYDLTSRAYDPLAALKSWSDAERIALFT